MFYGGDNTRGRFTSCVVYFRAPQERGKIGSSNAKNASDEYNVRALLSRKTWNKRFIIPLELVTKHLYFLA